MIKRKFASNHSEQEDLADKKRCYLGDFIIVAILPRLMRIHVVFLFSRGRRHLRA